MDDAAEILDITGEICPMTFVRTRLRLDRLPPGATLLVRLRGEEPARNVPRMAASLGHVVVGHTEADGVTSLLIRRGPAPDHAASANRSVSAAVSP